jgi:uncharacterized protein
LRVALALMLAVRAPKTLFCRAFPPGFWARFARHKVAEQLHRVGAQRPGDSDKFDQVDTSLAALVFGDKGLWLPDFCRQLLLLDTGVMSHCDKHLNEPGIFRGFKGLLHAPPGQRIGGRQFDPRKGLSQNWIKDGIGAMNPWVQGVGQTRKNTMKPTFAQFLATITSLAIYVSCGSGAAYADTFNDGVAAYQRGDYTSAIRYFRPLAENGNGDAQYNLGIMYDKGLGVPADNTIAAGWYRKAADLGIADAQCDLGILYMEGRGVPKDDAVAAAWFRKAADRADARSEYYLATMYLSGRGVSQSYKEASKWDLKAADQGFADAQQDLGTLYSKGQGVPKNGTEAIKWYRLAASNGLASAQFLLGYRLATGEGLPADPFEAQKWLRKAAEQNYPNAQVALDATNKAIRDISNNPSHAGKTAQMPPTEAAPSGITHLTGADLSRIVSTYRENEMRFKRDFLGRSFSDTLPFLKTTEKIFSKDVYRVSLGGGNISGDVDCTVSSPADIAVISNWNKGDNIVVDGVIKDVTLGSVQLEPCHLRK